MRGGGSRRANKFKGFDIFPAQNAQEIICKRTN